MVTVQWFILISDFCAHLLICFTLNSGRAVPTNSEIRKEWTSKGWDSRRRLYVPWGMTETAHKLCHFLELSIAYYVTSGSGTRGGPLCKSCLLFLCRTSFMHRSMMTQRTMMKMMKIKWMRLIRPSCTGEVRGNIQQLCLEIYLTTTFYLSHYLISETWSNSKRTWIKTTISHLGTRVPLRWKNTQMYVVCFDSQSQWWRRFSGHRPGKGGKV